MLKADAAVDMATVIASKSPIAVISTKHLMNRESKSPGVVDRYMQLCPIVPFGSQADLIRRA